MSVARLLGAARHLAGLSQDQLARLAHTSRTAVSAYENGRKKPTLDTAERLLGASGFDLELRPRITFHPVVGGRGRVYQVPDQLPSLPPHRALATVELPLSVNRLQAGRRYRLKDRSERARVYEAVLREVSCWSICGTSCCCLAIFVRPGNRWSPSWPPRSDQWLGGRPLTAFQLEVAQLFFSLPASDGFVLAGHRAGFAAGTAADDECSH